MNKFTFSLCSFLISASIAPPSPLWADSRQTELKGRVVEMDPMINSVRVRDTQGETLLTVPEDLLVRHGLKRLQYSDLHEGDLVEVRYWMDTLKAEKIDVLEKAPAVPTVAQRSAAPAGARAQ